MDIGPLQTTFDNLITVAQVIGGLLFVFFLSLAGIWFMTSGGNPQGVDRAKGAAVNACVGLALIFSARAIQALINNLVAR